MNVLIVAKTRVGGAVCVGALDAHGSSLRLYEPNWSFPPSNSPYQVGQLWDMSLVSRPTTQPPHVEDVAVTKAKHVGQVPNLTAHLRQRITPWTGGVAALFEGKLGFTSNGRGYVEEPNLPSRSTWFWTPDRELQRATIGGKVYYRSGGQEISYVGVDQPIATIPANALVRVSLARWWRPPDADPSFPVRCYLQLSGWYL